LNMPKWFYLICIGILSLAVITLARRSPNTTWELPIGIDKEQATAIIYFLSFAMVIFGILGAFWSNALDWFYWIWTVVFGAVFIWVIFLWFGVLTWQIYVFFIKNASSEEKKDARSVLEGWILLTALFVIVMALNIKWYGWNSFYESLGFDLKNFIKIVTHPGQPHPFFERLPI
jgi:hypothetical protein